MINKSDIFRIVRDQAKKITGTKVPEKHQASQVIDGYAVENNSADAQYKDLQQLFRYQFPSVTRQLLGKRYNTVNNFSKIFLPNGMEQAADEILELLADFASQLASTESVLAATGAKEVQQLCKDSARSQRAGRALKEVNKALAAAQGFVSGSTGLIGAAVDLPASVVFSLKTIYEIGHSYGFELSDEEDHKAVYFALGQIDLSLIAEKQALFLALRSAKNIFATGDVSQISGFLNSNYSVDQFKGYLVDESGNYKWPALQHLQKLKVVRFALPLVGGLIGAIYNARLIEEIATQADDIFAKARTYINQNPEADLFILDAYYQQVSILEQQAHLIETASPLLQAPVDEAVVTPDVLEAQVEEAKLHLEQSDVIESVEVVKRDKVKELESQQLNVEEEISEGLAKLAQENVVEAQESAITEIADEQVVEQEKESKTVPSVKKVVKKRVNSEGEKE